MGTRTLRQGLPRTAGGDAWPPPTEIEVLDSPTPSVTAPEPDERTPVAAEPSAAPLQNRRIRRGLPRVTGGDPWPRSVGGEPVETPVVAASVPKAAASAGAAEAVASPPTADVPTPAPAPTASGPPLRRGLPRAADGDSWPPAGADPATTAATPSEPASADAAAATESGVRSAGSSTERATESVALRRGLPRSAGGDSWPAAGLTATVAVLPVDEPDVDEPSVDEPDDAPTSTVPEPAPTPAAASVDATAALAPTQAAAPKQPASGHEPDRFGPFTKRQRIGGGIVGVIALAAVAAGVVLLVRWLLTSGPLQDFVQTYPGEYHLPEGAPVGFPGWLGWQHFFNVFLMVLIIRSGLQVRREKRPPAYWTPKNNPGGKVSLTVWFHQALDILWLVNGIVFVVLLFATGQWMRVIPTSWEVFPNALSAILQYVSLDWPTENGWVNYNSVQQLAYFATIFVAAPLAAVTGFRMSGIWPTRAEKLSRAYPLEWARAAHFPVMLYFVVFIAIHVFLVLATGALRNLNHMYAVQGSTDPSALAASWTGFWFFVGSLVVIAAAWVAARPLVLAPIARLFGTVSSR